MNKQVLRHGNPLLELQNNLIQRYSPDADARFFDPEQFPWVAELEAHWKVMRRDLDEALMVQEKIPHFADLSPRFSGMAESRWKSLVFYFYGRRVAANCDRFPATDALLQRIPDQKC
ncbi:aspartyl/asparaginyl beta-hydroxylase domain-containing protein [Gloeobacter violaceus]|uniref:Glr1104 protein n=1 Tax=Gloeobacter violaceus (strain ATCC 29082 / PCC 7421) TaxID=251221 RepID=Q7NLL8_GLOVI|nr:aspartyl/asparaginyl beta-hydroxylase domain-containing protein [Gloeobacter violaceus]BAC89045.1 glr1104 [Gloeobacter violaceus PCC 7421]